MFEFLEEGLNTVVDEVVDGFDLGDMFSMTDLDTGGVKRFPKDLSSKGYGGLRVEFSAYENKGIRLAEKSGTTVAQVINSSTTGSAVSNIVNSGVTTSKGYTLAKSVQNDTTSLLGGLLDSVKSSAESLFDTAKKVWNRDATSGESLSLATARNFTLNGTWQLFIPQSIRTSYSANWDRTNLQFLGKALDSIANKVPGGSSVVDGFKLLNGETLNPVSELLFNGIDHRSFSYSFSLFPKNADETALAQDLIKFFKTNMTPAIAPNTLAMVLRYPNYFKIRYLFKGKDNPYINKVAMCVLTHFGVQYHDNAPAFHRDGSPQSYVINLEFREIEPIYRDMMCKNNY